MPGDRVILWNSVWKREHMLASVPVEDMENMKMPEIKLWIMIIENIKMLYLWNKISQNEPNCLDKDPWIHG